MNKSYGSRIKDKRLSMGLKQKDLAELIGMSPTHLSHIECSNRDPSLKNARRIASVLGIEFDFPQVTNTEELQSYFIL